MYSIRHIVYECLPGMFAGGVQKMVYELASAQRRLGANVEIWTVDAARAGSKELHAGLPIRYFKPDEAWGYVRSAALLGEMAELAEDAIIHAHSTFHPLNHDVAATAGRLGLKIFFHPHCALDPVLFSGWSIKSVKKRLYLRFIGIPDLNKAAGIFALTPLEAEQLVTLGVKSPLHVVPNGITCSTDSDSKSVDTFLSTHRIIPQAKMILFVGRITAKKRLEDIIAAFAMLRSTSGVAVLAIAGNFAQDPAYYERLLNIAEELGCSENIRWLGFLDERAKPAAFAAADCFVHASESEGMALAILEAMSAGLPTVVTRGCYMRQAAEAGAVLECPQGAAALAKAIGSLLENEEAATALGKKARDYVAKEHDWSRLAARTLEIYDGKA
jgi:glycosyltransferase involved in cell wall biosynthesis